MGWGPSTKATGEGGTAIKIICRYNDKIADKTTKYF